MLQLLIATTNPGKVREFREMLDDTLESSQTIGLRDLPPIEPVEETGATFRANACLKATYYALAARCWTLADDSGLEVDALEGGPGVFSARWAEKHHAGTGDDANNALLLRQLEKIDPSQRTAQFVCVLALADENGRIVLTARDSVSGIILDRPRGSNGFGYDPLFYLPQLNRTTAELSPAEKHAISHRGKALARLRSMMQRAGIVPGHPAKPHAAY